MTLKRQDIEEYPYVVAWGRVMGSYDAYIADQVAQARADGAPRTATFKRDEWHTYEGIARADTKAEVDAVIASLTRSE